MEVNDASVHRPEPRDNQANHDQHAPLYNVVLLNDDDHTAEYVIEMLEKLFAIAAIAGLEARHRSG